MQKAIPIYNKIWIISRLPIDCIVSVCDVNNIQSFNISKNDWIFLINKNIFYIEKELILSLKHNKIISWNFTFTDKVVMELNKWIMEQSEPYRSNYSLNLLKSNNFILLNELQNINSVSWINENNIVCSSEQGSCYWVEFVY